MTHKFVTFAADIVSNEDKIVMSQNPTSQHSPKSNKEPSNEATNVARRLFLSNSFMIPPPTMNPSPIQKRRKSKAEIVDLTCEFGEDYDDDFSDELASLSDGNKVVMTEDSMKPLRKLSYGSMKHENSHRGIAGVSCNIPNVQSIETCGKNFSM